MEDTISDEDLYACAKEDYRRADRGGKRSIFDMVDIETFSIHELNDMVHDLGDHKVSTSTNTQRFAKRLFLDKVPHEEKQYDVEDSFDVEDCRLNDMVKDHTVRVDANHMEVDSYVRVENSVEEDSESQSKDDVFVDEDNNIDEAELEVNLFGVNVVEQENVGGLSANVLDSMFDVNDLDVIDNEDFNGNSSGECDIENLLTTTVGICDIKHKTKRAVLNSLVLLSFSEISVGVDVCDGEFGASWGHANLLCIVPILSDVPEGTMLPDLRLLYKVTNSSPFGRCGMNNWTTKGLLLLSKLSGCPNYFGYDYEIAYKKDSENIVSDAVQERNAGSNIHNEPIGGHSGVQMTVENALYMLLERYEKDGETVWIRECDVFQRQKHNLSAYPGLQQPLPIRVKVWCDISMDFFEGLLKSHGKTVIFVVVDKLSKQVTARQSPYNKLSAKYYGPFKTVEKVGTTYLRLACIIDNGTHWVEEVSNVLWAHRTLRKENTKGTPLNLVYEIEVVIPVEILVPTAQVAMINLQEENKEALRVNINLLEEKRDDATIQIEHSKHRMAKYYNRKVRSVSFKPRDHVLKKNEVSKAAGTGKTNPTWEKERGHANLLCIVPILSDVPEGTMVPDLHLLYKVTNSSSFGRCGMNNWTVSLL
nr:reverse transcriptase domain-containing protein [Tanacetum cinerariifolium]